jgi:indole-3-acetate monooxygenase
MTETLTTQSWIDKARSLAPLIEELRDVGERDRQLPQPIYNALEEGGFFRLWVPKAYGGHEVDIVTFQRIVEEVSRLDGAVGWNLLIGAEAGAIAVHFPAAVAENIFANGGVGAGSTNPAGRAETVPDGYRVNGRWPLASGCHHAGWFVGTSLIMQDGKPQLVDGGPQLRMMLFKPEDCEILDTWYSSGLRGTGSHDIEVKDLFVPTEHSFPFPSLPANPPGPLYRAPLPVLLAAPLAAVALGIAVDALESFIRLAGDKTPIRGSSKLAERQVNHLRVGQARALVESGRCFLQAAARRYMEALEQGPVASTDERTMLLRLAGSHAAQSAVQAVDLIYTASGTSAVYAGNRIERCSRDVRMITQHVGVAPSNIEAVGAHLLGLEGQLGR